MMLDDQAVLAERWRTREEQNKSMGFTHSKVCNTTSAVAFLYVFIAVWRRRSAGAALGTIFGSGLKLWWIAVLV